MKAIVISSFGSPDVLQLTELEDPHAGIGEIRVLMKTTGVQPADVRLRSGIKMHGVPVNLPQVLGTEFAGIVDEVGQGVTDFAVGDEVLGFRLLECYAEHIVVPAEQVVHKPKSMEWTVAGSLSASGQTAHIALSELNVSKGETLLVHAATGGVGSIAVQLARLSGATVIGTASESNHEYLRSLGAIPVSYGEGLLERVNAVAPDGVDVVLDAAGRGALDASVELVANRDRIGTIVDYERAEQLGVRGIRGPRTAARLSELVRLVEKGDLQVTVSKVFPLADAALAHVEVEGGHVRGKVVLTND